jgi:hypothetical protein
MNIIPRHPVVLLVAFFLIAGASQAARLEETMEPVREGLHTLAPVLQSATLLPFVGEILHALVVPPAAPCSSFDDLFEEAFGGPSLEAPLAGLRSKQNDPLVDEFSLDDLALLDL